MIDRLFWGFGTAADARASVEASLEEARALGHDSVGDEDLLLGILRAGEGRAAEVLSEMGVTIAAVREESDGMASDALSAVGISLEDVRAQAGGAFDPRIPEGRRIPFSPRAQGALERMVNEAVRSEDKRARSEHLLLGILGNEDGMAVRLLARLGLSTEVLEERLRGARGPNAADGGSEMG